MSPHNVVLGLICTLASFTALPLAACTDTCNKEFHPDAILTRDGCWIVGKQTNNQEIEITIEGLTTHASEEGSGCGAAIGPWRSATLRTAEIVDEFGKPFKGFSFEPKSAPGDSISCVIGSGAEGFFGMTTAEIEGGHPVSLRLTGTLESGHTLDDLILDIEESFLALGSTTEDGAFDGDHLSILQTNIPKERIRLIYADVR